MRFELAAQLDAFDEASIVSGLECKDKSLAVQSQAAETDINNIVKNFGLTGMAPQITRLPIQEDFVDITSFQEAQNALIEARASFMRVPAAIRARFDHDAGAFVDFCSDPANLDELRRLGLAPAAPVSEPAVDVPPVGPVIT